MERGGGERGSHRHERGVTLIDGTRHLSLALWLETTNPQEASVRHSEDGRVE